MSAEHLLSVLHGVRQTGHGRYLARCPAHDDESPSLSIRELDDGRILLHDFGGCGTDEVLSALGMSMSDLFPKSLPRRDGGYQPVHSRVPAADVLLAVAHEVEVAAILTATVVERRQIAEADWQRLALCASRIGGAAYGR